MRRDLFFEELKERSLRNTINDADYMEKRLKRLREIVEALPPRCREILVLNKFEGLKYRQIAERLQVSVKTIEAQMRIAYQKIREGFKSNTILLLLLLDSRKEMFQEPRHS